MIKALDSCFKYKVCVLALALVLGFVGIKLLSSAQPSATLAPVAPALVAVPTVKVTTPVQVYAPTAKRTLNLPQAVQSNDSKVVLTATDVPKSKHERTVSTVLDLTTGEAVQYVQEKPLPLFSKASTGSIGMYAGFKNTEPAVRLQATQDLFTVKAMTFGAIAAVDVTKAGRSDTFVGVGARLDW